MSRTATGRHAYLLAILLLPLALTGCGEKPSDPEAAVRALIAAAEQAARDRDPGLFKDHIATDYSDPHGNDRDAILKRLRLMFLRYQEPKLLTRIHAIRFPAPDRAEVELWLGTADTGRLAFDSQRLQLSLRRSDGDWQLLHAQWGRAAPGARLPHRPSTATAPEHTLTGFRSVGVLDIVSTMPARSSAAKAGHAAPWNRLATNGSEKGGLLDWGQ